MWWEEPPVSGHFITADVLAHHVPDSSAAKATAREPLWKAGEEASGDEGLPRPDLPTASAWLRLPLPGERSQTHTSPPAQASQASILGQPLSLPRKGSP